MDTDKINSAVKAKFALENLYAKNSNLPMLTLKESRLINELNIIKSFMTSEELAEFYKITA